MSSMCKSVKIDKANRRIDLIIKYVRQANKKKIITSVIFNTSAIHVFWTINLLN